MIIFFNKKTGKIGGTVQGRVHGEDQLKINMGDDYDKMVIQWVPILWFNEAGQIVSPDDPKAYTAEFIPNLEDDEMRDLIEQIDKGEKNIRDYKVNINTRKLTLK